VVWISRHKPKKIREKVFTGGRVGANKEIAFM